MKWKNLSLNEAIDLARNHTHSAEIVVYILFWFLLIWLFFQVHFSNPFSLDLLFYVSNGPFCPLMLWHCWLGCVAGKNPPQNDLLCVRWDVKPYSPPVVIVVTVCVPGRHLTTECRE